MQAQKQRRRAEPAYVSAGPALAHIEFLRDHGVGLKTVAKCSGVSHGSLSKLVYGTSKTKRSKRLKPETRDKILAVKPSDAADGALVDATKTWEIIDTLLSRGWTKAAIGRAIGQTTDTLQLSRNTVRARHARTIASLLDEPVPPRRSRHGLHPVPQPDPTDSLRDEARRAHQAERRARYRELERDPYDLPTLDLAPAVLKRGACRKPDVPTWLFFPMRGDNEVTRRAKAVCATCPVSAECLSFALENNEVGIWGGTTGGERRELRQESA